MNNPFLNNNNMNMNMNVNINMNMNNNMFNNPILNNNNMNMNNNMFNNPFINNNIINQNFINPNNFNQNMNLNNLNQINQNLNNNNSVEDVLPYINEPKKILRFSNISTYSNGSFITVKLPNSITISDLYSIAKKYQTDYCSEILLSCNNYLLKKENNSSIEPIPENSIINIIEDVDFPYDSYYDDLMKKYEKEEKIRIIFTLPSGDRKLLLFPNNISASEMTKAAFSKFSLNSKSTRIRNLYLSPNDKINILQYNHPFTFLQSHPLQSHWIFGKNINAKIILIDKNEDFSLPIGTLNSTLQLIKEIEINLGEYPIKVKKIIINNKLIERENIKSLASIGINEDFECFVVKIEELNTNNNN